MIVENGCFWVVDDGVLILDTALFCFEDGMGSWFLVLGSSLSAFGQSRRAGQLILDKAVFRAGIRNGALVGEL